MSPRRFAGLPLLLACLIFSAGCASVAVKSDDLETRTASAIGLERGQFTISERVDKGVRTDFTVTTRAGAVHRCYVTGAIGVVGAVVSDAVCTRGAGATVGSPAGATATPCNALLKAAGKC
jgi:hypothetical protein